jgi:hypothetical protein
MWSVSVGPKVITLSGFSCTMKRKRLRVKQTRKCMQATSQLWWLKSEKYSQTCNNDHLQITTTCQQWPVWSHNGQFEAYLPLIFFGQPSALQPNFSGPQGGRCMYKGLTVDLNYFSKACLKWKLWNPQDLLIFWEVPLLLRKNFWSSAKIGSSYFRTRSKVVIGNFRFRFQPKFRF